MLDHKPGKSTLTQGRAAGGPEPHAGKQSRVEQELGGPSRDEPKLTGADTTTSDSYSIDFARFTKGDVLIRESVTATLTHGDGKVKIDLHSGGMSVGDQHMTLNFKSPDAVIGKGLHVSGAKAEVIKGHTSRTGLTIEEDHAGVVYTTSWTVKGTGHHPWSVTLSFSTFIGAKPPHQHKKHWWQDLPLVGGVAAAIAAAATAIKNTSPEWGPVVVAAIAA